MVGGCRGYLVVAGLTENKTKPASWGLAELGNKPTIFRSAWQNELDIVTWNSHLSPGLFEGNVYHYVNFCKTVE